VTATSSLEFIPTVIPRPFSAMVRVGDTIYLSGQLGTDASGTLVEGFGAQSRQLMDNIAESLVAIGLDMTAIVKATIMLDDMARWEEFNAVYLTYFASDRLPARSAFGTSGLALGAHMEVECIAFAPQ